MPHCDYGVATTFLGRLLYALQNNVAQGLHAAPSGLDLGDITNRTTRLTEGALTGQELNWLLDGVNLKAMQPHKALDFQQVG